MKPLLLAVQAADSAATQARRGPAPRRRAHSSRLSGYIRDRPSCFVCENRGSCNFGLRPVFYAPRTATTAQIKNDEGRPLD